MRLRTTLTWIVMGLSVAVALPASAPAAEEGVEVLTRGPLHEAFAETVTFTPEPGIIIKKAPPEAIEEVPPDQKPEGENVAWIPGYWAWDDEREDFLWISGVWRALPPGRQWISGYWSAATDGYRWISGYWADAELDETRYYPEPPKTLEVGPSAAAPSAEHVWIPGVWVWHDGDYAWRPGYWMVPQPNWIWVPSHWCWTPSGYIFVDGYWDYSIPRRGIVFAPVYFTERIYTQPDYYYRPAIVINPVVLVSHVFLRPAYGHYYFGDYYAADYVDLGIYPRFSYQYRYGFDPLFAYQTWQHRGDQTWLAGLRQNYVRLQQDETLRPARTFAAARATTALAAGDINNAVAVSLNEVVRNNFTTMKFSAMQRTERERFATSAREFRQLTRERQNLEVKGAASADARARADVTEGARPKSEPVSLKMPRSPFASKAGARGARAARGETATEPRDIASQPEDRTRPEDRARAEDRTRPEDRPPLEGRTADREPRAPLDTEKTGRRDALRPGLDDRSLPRDPSDRATPEPRPPAGEPMPPRPGDRPGDRGPDERARGKGLEKAPGLERTPPGLERTPPGLEGTPPGLERTPPGLDREPAGAERARPGLDRTRDLETPELDRPKAPERSKGEPGERAAPGREPGIERTPPRPDERGPAERARGKGLEKAPGLERTPPGLERTPPGLETDPADRSPARPPMEKGRSEARGLEKGKSPSPRPGPPAGREPVREPRDPRLEKGTGEREPGLKGAPSSAVRDAERARGADRSPLDQGKGSRAAPRAPSAGEEPRGAKASEGARERNARPGREPGAPYGAKRAPAPNGPEGKKLEGDSKAKKGPDDKSKPDNGKLKDDKLKDKAGPDADTPK